MFYDHDRRLARLENTITNELYSDSNKDLIFRFESVLFAEGLKKVRVVKYLSQLNMLARWMDVDFKDATKEDIYRLVGEIEKRELSDYTKYDYKVCIKKFYRWIYESDEDPEITKWIKPSVNRKNSKLPEELLTESEIKKMILTANHPRDKAIVALLYDTGGRSSEIGNLRIRNVVFDQYGGVVTVNGKTGMRRVRIVFSCTYIAAWLDIHPQKDNPDAYLWVNIGKRNCGKQLTYQGLRILIQRIAKRAGIKKRVHNHLFRHSRSTELAQHLTEAQMEEHLGWVHGSTMPRTYVHMSGKQMDDAILKIHGIVKKEELVPELTNTVCPRCKQVNGPTSSFCSRCGMVLTIESAVDIEQKRSDIAMALMELVEKDSEVARILREIE